jgi:hypothetical protein
MKEGCRVAMEEANRALEEYPELQRIIFTPFNDTASRLYREAAEGFVTPEEEEP